jgi:hypothetical protein
MPKEQPVPQAYINSRLATLASGTKRPQQSLTQHQHPLNTIRAATRVANSRSVGDTVVAVAKPGPVVFHFNPSTYTVSEKTDKTIEVKLEISGKDCNVMITQPGTKPNVIVHSFNVEPILHHPQAKFLDG